MAANAQTISASGEPTGSSPEKLPTGLVTLLFTDIVGSTALKQQLGDRIGAGVIERHHQLVRETLRQFAGGKEVETAGDSFLIMCTTPSEAVKFALGLRARLRGFGQEQHAVVSDRIGIHLGEVVIREHADGFKPRDLYGSNVDICARVMSLAKGGQVLMSRGVFDSARQVLKGEDIPEVGALAWLNHGPYLLKGLDEPVEICEVREVGKEVLSPPTSSEKAQRQVRADEEPVLGWRPAVGQLVPNTQWVLEQKLGEGGFGEVWLGRHQTMKERRVFKFCFRADRVRSLKREMTLFRLIKERIGDHPNIVALREVYFEQPPYYLEEDYVAGEDLATWCPSQGGAEKVPLAVKLQIVAQIAEALQAAHDAGVIHRDVKPANILISGSLSPTSSGTSSPGDSPNDRSRLSAGQSARRSGNVSAKLTDFGIGQVVSPEYLAGVTKAGFTMTLLGSESSSQTGTQMYMAPEVVAGMPATTRSDIFSLGVVLFQLLAGDFRKPLTTDWGKHVNDPLLREDLQQCFAGDPRDRFAGAEQLARSLRAWDKRKAERQRQEAELAEREAMRQRTRRRQALLLTVGAVALVLFALTATLAYGLRKARVQRDIQRRLAYAADMSLAQQSLAMNDLGRARSLLEANRPVKGGLDLRGWEWRYLWWECRNQARSELCRISYVNNLALSPDGRTLALASDYHELWSVPDRRRICRLPGETGAYGLEAYSPRGDLLATDAPEGRVNLWQAGTTNLVRQFLQPPQTADLKFSPDGKELATMSRPGEVAIWDVTQGTRIRTLPEAPGRSEWHTGALDFSPDGKAVATGDKLGNLRIIEWETGRTNVDIAAHDLGITSLAWSPQDPIVATSAGYGIRLWNATSGRLVGALEGHTSMIWTLRFSADGKLLYSASADQTIRIWQVSQPRCLATLRGSNDEVFGLAVSPDGTNLVSGTKDGVVALWSAIPRATQAQPSEARIQASYHGSPFAFRADGQGLAVVRDQGVRLLEVPSLKEVERIEALGTNVAAVTCSPDGKLLVGGSADGWLRVWSFAQHSLVHESRDHRAPVLQLRFSGDGTRLLSGDDTGALICWDPHGWRRLSTIQAPGVAAISPDGRRVVTGSSEGMLSWWNTTDGRSLGAKLAHPGGGLHDVVFSPDGSMVVSGGNDETVAIRDAVSGTLIRQFRADMHTVVGIGFSPDGRRLLTGGASQEAAVKVWDMSTYRELAALPGQGSWFSALAFSPDASCITSCGWDGHMNLWRAPSWAEIDAAEKVGGPKPTEGMRLR